MAEKSGYVLGESIHGKATELLATLDAWCSEQFQWTDEVLAEAKKTMAIESIQLLPKTPTDKKRLQQRCQQQICEQSNSTIEDDRIDSLKQVSKAATYECYAADVANCSRQDTAHVADDILAEQHHSFDHFFDGHVISGSLCIHHQTPELPQVCLFPELADRETIYSSLTDVEEHLPGVECRSEAKGQNKVCHKAKLSTSVSRKSRKRKMSQCRSVSVQTVCTDTSKLGSSPTSNRVVSISTQTDHVVVIPVSEWFSSSKTVSDDLFKVGRAGLMPELRQSGAGCVDSVLPVPGADTHSCDRGSQVNTAAVVHSTLFPSITSLHSSDNENLAGASAVQDMRDSGVLVNVDSYQLNKATVPVHSEHTHTASKQPSVTEYHQLSRWTTCTRLDTDASGETDAARSNPAGVRESLEKSASKYAELQHAGCRSDAPVMKHHGQSHLPSSSVDVLSLNSRVKSYTDSVRADGTRSSNSSRTRQSAGNRAGGTGLRKSRGRLHSSSGRKSLSQQRALAAKDKCHATKLNRPAAWLMNATKASRNKAVEKPTVHEKAAATASSNPVKHVPRPAAVATSTVSALGASTATPCRPNSSMARSRMQKLQNLFSPKSSSSNRPAVDRANMPPPCTPVVKRSAVPPPTASPVKSAVVVSVGGPATTARRPTTNTGANQCVPVQQRVIDASPLCQHSLPSTRHHNSPFTLQCLSPRRSSSLQSLSKVPTHRARGQTADRKPTGIARSSSERKDKDIAAAVVKRGLLHRIHDRFKVNTHITPARKFSSTKKQPMIDVNGGRTCEMSGCIAMTSAAALAQDAAVQSTSTTVLVHQSQCEDVVEVNNNYDISDLCSDDSTDDESEPKKTLPAWATGEQLMAVLFYLHLHPVDALHIFGCIEAPDLNKMFDTKRPRFDKRTSSANWETASGIAHQFSTADACS